MLTQPEKNQHDREIAQIIPVARRRRARWSRGAAHGDPGRSRARRARRRATAGEGITRSPMQTRPASTPSPRASRGLEAAGARDHRVRAERKARSPRSDPDRRGQLQEREAPLGDGDRPQLVHRLQRVRRGLQRREQHPDRRPGADQARPRDDRGSASSASRRSSTPGSRTTCASCR